MIYCIIPARQNSKAVSHKNIRMLAGKPVLQHSIISAKQLLPNENIYLSTDSENYAQIGKEEGINIRMRSDIACSDTADGSDILLDLIYAENFKPDDIIVVFLPSCPYRPKDLLLSVWDKLPEFIDSYYNSMRTGHEMSETVYKKYFYDQCGGWESIYPELSVEDCDIPRQSFRKSYSAQGFLDCTKVSAVIGKKKYMPSPIMAVKIPFIPEIDTEEDFNYLKYIMEVKNAKTN